MSKEKNEEREFLERAFQVILQYTKHDSVCNRKVIDFKTPQELSKLIDFSLPKIGVGNEELLELLKATFEYSGNVNHSKFLNQIYAKPDPYGVSGEILATSLSVGPTSLEVAPVFLMAEEAVIQKSLQLVGYETGDGTFCPGGSYCNMLGMNLAKFNKFPETKAKGVSNMPRIALFGSKQCHYSIRKNAILLGFGTNSVIDVECDLGGSMLVSDLEAKIIEAKSNGYVPLYVQATSGTTVMGAFDPLSEIGDVCKKYDVWMHVDGAYGISVLFSRSHKHLCRGINKADSVAWNPHKLMSAPIQCSLFLTRHKGLMSRCHSVQDPETENKIFSSFLPILIHKNRRDDCFKFWMMWKARGDKGFEAMINKAFDNIHYFTEQIKHKKHFKLVYENPVFTNVSFWYIPPSLRKYAEDDEFWKKMNLVAPKIKSRMQKEGTLMVGYQPLGDKVNFFRLAVISKDVDHQEMDFVLEEIERLGADL